MMQETKGHCKHGEFLLRDGCPQCLAEKQGQPIKESTALVPAPGEDAEVTNYYEQAVKLQEYAESRVIKTIEDIKIATDDLTIISRLKKAMEEKRREYIKPLQESVKAINDNYKFWMGPIEAADSITREKILGFNREQNRIRQEQEEINRQKQEIAEREAALNGHAVEPVELVEVSPEAPKRVSTDMGTTGQRENWKWEVTDFSLVPDEYKMINAGVLTPIVKASKGKIIIPGVRIYNEPIIAVNAR